MAGYLFFNDKAILQAPPQLGPGEGFYQQEPFQTIVEQVSGAFHVPQDKIRELITFLGKGRHWRVRPEQDHPDYTRWMDERSMRARRSRRGRRS